MPLRKPAAPGKLLLLPPERIRPNPDQPRRCFDREALVELAASIAQHGLLQPVTVRKSGGDYLLVAGERRLRAAKLAGIGEIPCLLLPVNEAQSGLLALVENLQRRDLDYWEQAEGIARLMGVYGLSQDQAAQRLGMSQSALANKLRLLKHPPAVRAALRQQGLSERHARALLRLPEAQRLEAVAQIARRGLNVAQTEAWVEGRLGGARGEPPEAPGEETPPSVRPARKLVVRDLRLFLNSVDHHLETLRSSGIPADLQRSETPEEIVLTIRLPKARGSRPNPEAAGRDIPKQGSHPGP